MSYFAVDPAWWPAIRERLPRPLSREEACTDLRWWQDRELGGVEQMPSYRKLAASWGWLEVGKKDCKKARLLLANEAAWSDPYKLQAWRDHRGRNEGADGAQEGRSEGAAGNGETPDTEAKGRNEGARGAQAGRTKGDTREPLAPQITDHPPQATEEQRAREVAPPLAELLEDGLLEEEAEPGRLEEDRAVLVALQERDEPQHGLCSQRDIAALTVALTRGCTRDQLCALWAWSAVSEDPLIAGCRKGGWRRWASLLRQPNGQPRIGAALAWVAAGRPAGSATGPPVARSSSRRFSVAELLNDDEDTITATGDPR